MNTVFSKILVWCLVTLILSMLALTAISYSISVHRRNQEAGSSRLNRLFLEQAVDAYRSGGPERLAVELARMDRYTSPDRHYLLDRAGIDLATGKNRTGLLDKAHTDPPQIPFLIVPRSSVDRSSDGAYRLVVLYNDRYDFRVFVPVHALLLIVVAVLCGTLAANLAAPLRRLARAVDRFGAGDLSIRVNSKRKDEIGDVSRAFDRMAERIGTLLTAERRLLQDISHELRSPLARLSFAAELARTAPDRNAAIARLNKEIARLTDLVGGLIQVTRAEGDPTATNSQFLRLDQLVAEIVSDCRVEAEQRNCKIACDDSAIAATLHGDREVLRRAIENVLRNAVRYTLAGSAIEVTLARCTDTVRIAVRDHGPGVPDDALPKIFQPFFRLDDSRDASTGGVGLGLAIAHRAVTLHHGRLWAENASPGLRVCIELPLVNNVP